MLSRTATVGRLHIPAAGASSRRSSPSPRPSITSLTPTQSSEGGQPRSQRALSASGPSFGEKDESCAPDSEAATAQRRHTHHPLSSALLPEATMEASTDSTMSSESIQTPRTKSDKQQLLSLPPTVISSTDQEEGEKFEKVTLRKADETN